MDKREIARRQQKLLDAMKLSSRITVDEAVEYLGVSKSTVVRLLIEMEKKGLITRVQNGAVLKRTNFEYTYDQLEFLNFSEKEQIGKVAAALISSGDDVYLDSGTTLPHLCLALAGILEAGEVKGIRIFTRSLVNLNILQKYPRVYLIGGEYHIAQRDFNGYISEETVRQLHFDKCFLGADGIDMSAGITTNDFSSARLNGIVFSNSYEKYIVSDSSKFKKISSVRYADVNRVTKIITDGNNPAFLEALKNENIGFLQP